MTRRVTENDSADTQEDAPVDIDVLINDSDVDQEDGINANPGAEVLRVDRTGLADPSHGTAVVVVKDGKDWIRYTPDADYNGTDTFTYYAYDGDAKTIATVTVDVSPVNDSPIAVNDSITTPEDNERNCHCLG